MEETQSFRVFGRTDVVEIAVNQVDGSKVVFWDNIEQVFRRLAYVKKGKVAVPHKRDSDNNKLNPLCIGYLPDEILDVVLESQNGTVESSDEVSTCTSTTQVSQEAQQIEGIARSLALGTGRLSWTIPQASTPWSSLASQTRSPNHMRDPTAPTTVRLADEIHLKGEQQPAFSLLDSFLGTRRAFGEGSDSSYLNMGGSYTESDGSYVSDTTLAASVGNLNGSFSTSNFASYENVVSLRQDAESGVAHAQFLLGEKYDKGELAGNGVDKDSNLQLAFEWYKKAGVQGHVQAQRNLGFMYKHGRGVVEDYKEAQKWFKLAGDQGDVGSLVSLASMKKNGQGGEKNMSEFVELAGKALLPLLFEGQGHRFF
ncbi:uncharacterized protein EMPS_01638 [Entomortierella parvispora]|uniref:Uncharacterized protein n=1 Tax=Entomortierella parvispora TaxID=205924 RepID=A0A9P3LSZ7_9FUNG|nr:uncharacterized protein EMPS_01638 [Entomortierella parvispora]